MRIVFMGSPELAVPSLRAVSDIGQVAGVITQPPRRKGRGQKTALSSVALESTRLGIDPMMPDSVRTPEFLKEFSKLEPDIAVVVAYGKILPPELLAIPRLGCINVHASLLPELRGAAPIQWAIARGYSETGITLMQMDEGMDTGPILLQESIPIGMEETSTALAGRLSLLGADILRKGLPALERGELSPVAQDESRATYAPLLKKVDGWIDWSMDAAQISNRVRGFTPWPGTHTTLRGKRLLITAAQPDDYPSPMNPGEVLETRSVGILVACGQGALLIGSLKPEGKNQMTAGQFLTGHKLEPGDRFGG